MATIYKQGSGYSLQIGAGKTRRTKRLGKLSKAGAAEVKSYVNTIETCRRTASALPEAVVAWLDSITDDLHAALAGAGLVPERRVQKDYGIGRTLARIIQDHIDRRPDLRPFTRNTYVQTKNRVADFFKARPVTDITPADARDFKRAMLAEGYAQATVAGYINKTRQILNDAVDRGLIAANPFRKVAGGTQVNEDRLVFVGRDTIAKVVAATNDPEWKLLFSFARYAGVRVPSEVAELSIDDVDFAASRVVIHSPKTRKHGKPKRIIPLFPELRPLLRQAVDAAKADGRTRLMPTIRADYNPHTQAVRLVKAAGLPVWGKVFQNLRSTRETELLIEGQRLHVVCRWIGNSPAVAQRHYLQITGEDWERATGAAKSAAHGTGDSAHLANVTTQNPDYQRLNDGNAVLVYDLVPRSGLEPETR